MPTLQCPKCKQPIDIKSMPADNRVKCGSCSAEFSLKAPAKPAGQAKSDSAKAPAEKAEKAKSSSTAQQSTKPTSSKPTASKPTSAKPTSAKATTASASKTAASTATAEADDPFAAIDLNSLGKSKRVDLGVAPVHTGPMESPSGGMAPWLPGNAPAYVPIQQPDASKGGAKAGNEPAKITPAAKKSNLGVTIAVIAVLVMMAGGSIVAAIIVASK